MVTARKGPARRRAEEGQALLVALLTLFMVSVALSLAASALALHQKAVQDEVRDVKLRAHTDAALARTLAELRRNRNYGGIPEEDFDGGWIASKVEAVSGLMVRIEARAGYADKEQAVSADVRMPLGGLPRVTSWERMAAP